MRGRVKPSRSSGVMHQSRFNNDAISTCASVAASHAWTYCAPNVSAVAHACCKLTQASRSAGNPISPARATRKCACVKIRSRSRSCARRSPKFSRRNIDNSCNATRSAASPRRSRRSSNTLWSKIVTGAPRDTAAHTARLPCQGWVLPRYD